MQNKPMQVTYNYNEIDQLIFEFGQEKLKGNGYGSPYEIYYDYDADGNMIEKTLYKGWSSYPPTAGSEKVTTYTYDAEDRLTGIQFPTNQTNSFYDCICGAKQMEWTDSNGEITRYFLDGDQVLFEYDGRNRDGSMFEPVPPTHYDNLCNRNYLFEIASLTLAMTRTGCHCEERSDVAI